MNPKIDELRVAIRDAETEGDWRRAGALKGALLAEVRRSVDSDGHPTPVDSPADPAVPPDADQGARRPAPLEVAGTAQIGAAEQAQDWRTALRLKGAQLRQRQEERDLDPRSAHAHQDFQTRIRNH